MRADEFLLGDSPPKLNLFSSAGQLPEPHDQQVSSARTDSRKWTSFSQPPTRRPSTVALQFDSCNRLPQTLDDLHSDFLLNAFPVLSYGSQFDLEVDAHSLSQSPPDLYTDFSSLLERLEVPLTPGSGVLQVTTSPTPPNTVHSLSPLCFPQSRSRSPSPETAAAFETGGKAESLHDTRPMAGGKVQRMKIPRHKRPSHQRAEAKRRIRIQDGLDQLRHLVPTAGDNVESSAASSSSRSKNSKADLLRKSADYCRRLHMEYNSMLTEADDLRAELLALTSETKHCQDVLPAEGINKSRGPNIPIQQMFSDYVQSRGLGNWKFWIFGQLMRPVFESYTRSVSPANNVDLGLSVMNWAHDYLSLIALRPALLNGMRTVVSTTSVVSHPERLEEEVRQSIMKDSGLIPPVDLNTGAVAAAR